MLIYKWSIAFIHIQQKLVLQAIWYHLIGNRKLIQFQRTIRMLKIASTLCYPFSFHFLEEVLFSKKSHLRN